MDIFKAEMNRRCGVGGIHCDCCNPYFNGKKEKRILNKLARQRLKRDLKKEEYYGEDQ